VCAHHLTVPQSYSTEQTNIGLTAHIVQMPLTARISIVDEVKKVP